MRSTIINKLYKHAHIDAHANKTYFSGILTTVR